MIDTRVFFKSVQVVRLTLVGASRVQALVHASQNGLCFVMCPFFVHLSFHYNVYHHSTFVVHRNRTLKVL